jgi:hypothetical protein
LKRKEGRTEEKEEEREGRERRRDAFFTFNNTLLYFNAKKP